MLLRGASRALAPRTALLLSRSRAAPLQPPRRMPAFASASGSSEPEPAASKPAAPPAPASGGIRLVRVESREAAWDSGVAARDNGKESAQEAAQRIALLAAGDAASLLLFAAIGRSSHAETLMVLDVLSTAAPFLAAWAVAAPLAGAYGEAARGGDVRAALGAAVRAWAVAVPSGLALRSLSQGGRLPPLPFALVTLGATLVLLLGWRAGAAAAAPKRDRAMNSRQNKKGGVFDFLQLLSGLTKRW